MARRYYKQINVHMSGEMYAAILLCAEKHKQSIGEYLRSIISYHLNKESEK